MKDTEFLKNEMKKLVKKFLPKEAIVGIMEQRLKLDGYSAGNKELVLNLFSSIYRKLKKNENWSMKLQVLYQDKYPLKVKEFFYNGQLAVFGKEVNKINEKITYTTKKINYLSNPTSAQLFQVAPALVNVVETRSGINIKGTVDIDRLKVFETEAVIKSSLVNVEVRNRPMVAVKPYWELSENNLPLWVIPARIVSKEFNELVIAEFFNDIKTTIAWKDSDSLATFLCCLIQPMLVHLKPGMFPSYLFRGPSNSGKGFLSTVIPKWLYVSNIEYPVFQRKFPRDSYEFTVSMAAAKDSLFYSFDEIKDISDEQLKDFDHIATASELTYRQMREGVFKTPNYLTFTMTGVYVNLTDETWGRLGLIELTDTRTVEIEKFMKRWQNKAPELLRAIFSILTNWYKTDPKYSYICGRRPGFGIVSDACEAVFGVSPRFDMQSSVNDLLEAICSLEANNSVGDWIGKRKRLTRRQILNQLNEQHAVSYTPKEIMLKLKTSLGGSSQTNYQAQDGLDYKIVLREEGDEKRVFIYVNKLKCKKTDSTEIDT